MSRPAFTLVTHRGVVLKIYVSGLFGMQVEVNGNEIVLLLPTILNAKLND
jgi:hypothetical protein